MKQRTLRVTDLPYITGNTQGADTYFLEKHLASEMSSFPHGAKRQKWDMICSSGVNKARTMFRTGMINLNPACLEVKVFSRRESPWAGLQWWPQTQEELVIASTFLFRLGAPKAQCMHNPQTMDAHIHIFIYQDKNLFLSQRRDHLMVHESTAYHFKVFRFSLFYWFFTFIPNCGPCHPEFKRQITPNFH